MGSSGVVVAVCHGGEMMEHLLVASIVGWSVYCVVRDSLSPGDITSEKYIFGTGVVILVVWLGVEFLWPYAMGVK